MGEIVFYICTLLSYMCNFVAILNPSLKLLEIGILYF